jgi:hypothetical protein
MPTFTGGPYRFVRWGLAGALVALVLVGAGCGSGGALALDPVASAADRTLDKGTGRLRLANDVHLAPARSGDGLRRGVVRQREAGNGRDYEPPRRRSRHADLCGAPAPPTRNVRAARRAARGWTAAERQELGEGRPGRALKKLGVDFANLGIGQSPTEALAQLRGSANTQKVGTETIDGVRTTHYRGTVDVQDALGRATAKERKALQRCLTRRRRTASTRRPRRTTSGWATTGSCAG